MYLNQKVKFEKRLEDLNNAYGEFTYEPIIEIKARKQPKEEEVVDKEGHIHKSSFEIYTKLPIKVDDLIDGRLVLFSEGYVNLSGKIVLYRGLTI